MMKAPRLKSLPNSSGADTEDGTTGTIDLVVPGETSSTTTATAAGMRPSLRLSPLEMHPRGKCRTPGVLVGEMEVSSTTPLKMVRESAELIWTQAMLLSKTNEKCAIETRVSSRVSYLNLKFS